MVERIVPVVRLYFDVHTQPDLHIELYRIDRLPMLSKTIHHLRQRQQQRQQHPQQFVFYIDVFRSFADIGNVPIESIGVLDKIL